MEVQVRYATEFGSSATVINVTEIPSFAKRFKLLSVNPHEEQTDLKPSTKLHIGEVVDESYPEKFRQEAPKTGSLTEAIKEVINNQLKEMESIALEEENKVLVEMQQIPKKHPKYSDFYESCDLCHYNAFFKYQYNGEILHRCQTHKIVDIKNLKGKFGFGEHKPKGETLEEAGKDFIENTMKFSFNSMDTRTQANRMLKCVEFGAKWHAETHGKEKVNDLLEMLKRSITEINHLKHTYKDKGHCVKYLSDCETIIEQYKNK